LAALRHNVSALKPDQDGIALDLKTILLPEKLMTTKTQSHEEKDESLGG